MTLKELDKFISCSHEKCYMIYTDVKFQNKVNEIWTPHTTFDRHYDNWTDNSLINKEVITFKACGWQSNIYDVVLK